MPTPVDRRGAPRAAPLERRRRARRRRPRPARAARLGARRVRRAPARAAARARPLLERRELLLDLVQLESGKTRGQAFEEVYQAASVTRYNALVGTRVLRGGRRARRACRSSSTTRVRYRAEGRRRRHHAVELRAQPRRDGRRPRPRRRLRGRAEGRRPGRAHDPRAAPRVHRRRRARGALGGRRRSRRRGRRGAHRRGRLHLLHRLDRDRPPDRREGRPTSRRRLARARRQERADRARRRRPRAGRGGCRVRRASRRWASCASRSSASTSHAEGRRAVPARPRRAAARRRRSASALDYGADFGSLASAGAARARRGRTSTTPSRRAPTVLVGGRHRPDVGPLVLRADRAHRRHPARCAPTPRRRSAPIASLYLVDSDEEADPRRERERVRPERVGASPARRRRGAPRRRRARGRQRQHQRGLPRLVRLGRRARWAASSSRASVVATAPEGLLRFVDPVTISTATGLHPAAAHRPRVRRDGRAVPAARASARAIRRR